MKYFAWAFWITLIIFIVAPSNSNNSTDIWLEPENKTEHRIWIFEEAKREKDEREGRLIRRDERREQIEEIDALIGVLTPESE